MEAIMDISKLSVAELRDLQQQIPQEMKRREAQEKANVLNELKAVAKARGYSLDELVGKEAKLPKVKGGAGTVKVKYRHPENSELQWTGRGRQPKWVESWLKSGGTLDKLVI
jgi:DNA-binding protein H-NS